MTTPHMVELLPLEVPAYAQVKLKPGNRQDGFHSGMKVFLPDIDPQTLSVMCDEWRAAVFSKAGTIDPHRGDRTALAAHVAEGDAVQAAFRDATGVINDKPLPALVADRLERVARAHG